MLIVPDPSAAVLSAGVAMVLVGVGVLLVDTKRPAHQNPSGLPEWLGLIALLLGAFGNGTLDSQAGLGEQAPFIATFCAGGAVFAVAGDRCSRARHAAILGRAAGALDETVVSGHQMTGRFRRRTVEVLLSDGGVNEYSSMVVVLADCAGRTDWCVVYGRCPGRRWRSKGWQVKSEDPALADRLTRLGAPTLVRRRYDTAAGRWDAELQPPSVYYSAERRRLRYCVAVGGTSMDTLSRECLRPLLDMLWNLAELNERVDGTPAPGEIASRPPTPEQPAASG